MTMYRAKPALLGSSALLCLLTGAPALAQPVAAPPPPAGEQTVVVTGSRPIAESDRAALAVQRTAPSLVSVLSADEAGRLADQNIAFAVGRLPGVAVERDQGQARYINLRGQPRRWTNISFDGLNIVSPEGRQTRFDNVPSAIASRVTVTKAVTPDMPGDTVAGNVDVRTRSAFDYRGSAVRGGLQLGRVELGGGEEIDANLVVSNRILDDRVGLLAQVSYYTREMVTDNWETDPWILPGQFDRRPGAETRGWAREHENKLYRLTRGNISGSLRADIRPADGHSLFAQTIYSQFTDNELRNNYIFRFDTGSPTTPTGACPAGGPIPVAGTNGAYDICNGNTPLRGTVLGARLDTNFRTAFIKEFVSTTTLGGAHALGGWTVDWRLNYTYTEDGQEDAAQPFFRSPGTVTELPSFVYDFTDPQNHRFQLFRTQVAAGSNVRSLGAPVTDIEAFAAPFREIELVNGGTQTQAWTGRIDFSHDTTLFGRETVLKVGALYTDRRKENDAISQLFTLANLTAGGIRTPAYADWAIPGGFQGDMTVNYTFRYYSEGALLQFARDIEGSNAPRTISQPGFYQVGEETLAAYAMATTTLGFGTVVYGVRLEQTTNTGRAFSPTSPANNPALLSVTSDDDLEVYPSLHLNWDLNDEMKVRFGITTGAARPDFDQLAPNLSIDNANRTITGGNPDATRERAVGVDVYWEWYMQPQGYMSVGLFHKDLKDVLFTETTDWTSDVLGPNFNGFRYSRIANGGSGSITGLEVAWNQFAEPYVRELGLPAWMEGIGWRLTATVTESDMEIPGSGAPGAAGRRSAPLSGASDLVYNASLVYEKYGISARLAYQFRTEWLQSVGAYAIVNGVQVPNGNGDIYWAEDGELDFSLRYQLSDAIQLTFDAVNLANDPALRYADNPTRTIEWERFGPRYLVGARFRY